MIVPPLPTSQIRTSLALDDLQYRYRHCCHYNLIARGKCIDIIKVRENVNVNVNSSPKNKIRRNKTMSRRGIGQY